MTVTTFSIFLILLFSPIFTKIVNTPFGPYVLKRFKFGNENQLAADNPFGVTLDFVTFSLQSDLQFNFKLLNFSVSPDAADSEVVFFVAGGGTRMRDFHDTANRLVERQILSFTRLHQPSWMQPIIFKPKNWLFIAPILSDNDTTFADDFNKLSQIGKLCKVFGKIYNQKRCHFIGYCALLFLLFVFIVS
jgi:hypothetical protein